MKGITPQGKLFAIWLGSLSFLSGMVNIATLLLFTIPSTHMTGNLSQLLLSMLTGKYEVVLVLLGVLIAFVMGGILSGLLFSEKVFHFENRYGLLMMFFSVLLLLVNWLGLYHLVLYCLAFIIGTQNGMFIYYRGMIVRNSHFTGYLTDMGFAFGRWIRGHREEKQKIVFYGLSMLCFLLGGTTSYYVTIQLQERIIVLIAACDAIVGLYYFVLRTVKMKTKERDE